MYKDFDPALGAPEAPLDEERPGGIWAPNQAVISKPDVSIAIYVLEYCVYMQDRALVMTPLYCPSRWLSSEYYRLMSS
jgi:hypothetical protein